MASAPINKVQDKNGDQFFPITHQQAVINDNGDDLVTILAQMLPLSGGEMTGAITPASGQANTPWQCSSLTTGGGAVIGSTAFILGSSFDLNRNGNTGQLKDTSKYGMEFEVYSNRVAIKTYTSGGLNSGRHIVLGASGKVGFGLDSPSVAVDVSGSIAATGTITPGSDTRIKDNQQAIDPKSAMDVISRLIPKTWEWNEKAVDDAGKKAAGLIAQEVAKILPEAVVIKEALGFKDFHALNYNSIQGYEIAAIKGLIEEVKALRKELAELKNTK